MVGLACEAKLMVLAWTKSPPAILKNISCGCYEPFLSELPVLCEHFMFALYTEGSVKDAKRARSSRHLPTPLLFGRHGCRWWFKDLR